MSDDSADEIARALVAVNGIYRLDDPMIPKLAAALRSYGRAMADAKLEEAALQIMAVVPARPGRADQRMAVRIVRSLKSKPEAQDTQT